MCRGQILALIRLFLNTEFKFSLGSRSQGKEREASRKLARLSKTAYSFIPSCTKKNSYGAHIKILAYKGRGASMVKVDDVWLEEKFKRKSQSSGSEMERGSN